MHLKMEKRKQKAMQLFHKEVSNEKKHRLSNFLCQQLMVRTKSLE
jgi:hypothetical protein